MMAAMPMGELIWFAAIICAAGVVSGILAGTFGVGGGAILVPVFYQVFGLLGVDESVRMHLCVGSSLAIIVPTSLRSYFAHRARGAVDDELLRSYMISVPAGTLLASALAAYISSRELRILFTAFTLLFGFRLLFNRDNWRLGDTIPGNPWRSVFGVGLGFFSTLLGIGGGILNNTFMTLYGRPMKQAVATSSGVGVLIAIPGTLGYIWAGWGNPLLPLASTGFINWIAVGLIIPIALVVTPWGVKLAHALDKRHLEIAFGLFCLAISLRFFVSLV